MKVLFVCDECKKLHTLEVVSLILIKPDLALTIVGSKNIALSTWDNLANQLPDMVRHENNDCTKQMTGGGCECEQ